MKKEFSIKRISDNSIICKDKRYYCYPDISFDSVLIKGDKNLKYF